MDIQVSRWQDMADPEDPRTHAYAGQSEPWHAFPEIHMLVFAPIPPRFLNGGGEGRSRKVHSSLQHLQVLVGKLGPLYDKVCQPTNHSFPKMTGSE